MLVTKLQKKISQELSVATKKRVGNIPLVDSVADDSSPSAIITTDITITQKEISIQ